jgi:hypothetical protein
MVDSPAYGCHVVVVAKLTRVHNDYSQADFN